MMVSAEFFLKSNSLCLKLDSKDRKVLKISLPKFEDSLMISDNDTTFWGYYGGVNYFPAQQVFFSCIPNWTESNSSEIQPEIAYLPNQDGQINQLKETIQFNAGHTINSVLPSIPNKPSPYREKVASSMVVEWWYDNFDKLGELVDLYHDYGMDNIIVLVHRWQHHGFDTKLPVHMPPDPARGGMQTLKNAIQTALKNGQLIALHENYVDMYPDSPLWDDKDLLITSSGQHQKAWADSKHISPSKIMKYARKEMGAIQSELGPRVCFLDVHSTHLPWWRTDYGSKVPFSGMMHGTWKFNNELWAYARETYQGPVFGEGFRRGSWLHSGNLDSVMAQCSINSRLFADFILTKIRPLQINHGVGYYERWEERKYERDWMRSPMSPENQDLYQCMEVAYQTAATIDDKIKNNITLAARSYYQLRPLISGLVNNKITTISYHDNNEWLDSSQAILSPSEKIKRLKLTFDNDTQIYINLDKTPWVIDGKNLAPYSFEAKGGKIAATSNIDANGNYFDHYRSDEILFLDPRNYDWAIDPMGTWYFGRSPKHKPRRSNDGTAKITTEALTSDIAIACVKENKGWRVRFFPQRSSGTAHIDGNSLKYKISKATALDRDGNEITKHGDTVAINGNKLTITRTDPKIWSYIIN